MRIRFRKTLLAVILTILVGCGGGDGSGQGITVTGGPDLTPPSVYPLFPGFGASSIYPDITALRLGHDEPIDPGSLAQATIVITPSVAFTPRIVSAHETRLELRGNLQPGTTYSVRVSGITDAAGNEMLPLEWRFSTRASGWNAGTTWYISPQGDDANDGRSTSSPFRTFAHAFSVMAGGDELVLLDGEYTESGTGILSGVQNIHPPDGTSLARPTLIRALNPGAAVIRKTNGNPYDHALHVGRSTRKVRNVVFDGLKLIGGVQFYNTDGVTLRNSGVEGSLSVGTNDHNEGNTNNLIEDVWVWAVEERVPVINYRANNNVWRRVVLRSEGCATLGCNTGKPDGSVGMTVYNSRNVSVQNLLIVDRLLRGDGPYGDFATAQHVGSVNDPADYFGQNEWLGCMSVNSQDSAMFVEADNIFSVAPGEHVWRVRDFLALRPARGGINLGSTPGNYVAAGSPPSLFENLTVLLAGGGARTSGVRIAPSSSPPYTTAVVRNAIVEGATFSGVVTNGSTYETVAAFNPGAAEGDFLRAADCRGDCVSRATSVVADGSIRWPVKVETGSPVTRAVPGITGARLMNRYGVDGSRFGEPGFNTLTSASLWPWPNEGRIRADMCTGYRISPPGFCASGLNRAGTGPVTLTSYVWEFLGTPMPAGIYAP